MFISMILVYTTTSTGFVFVSFPADVLLEGAVDTTVMLWWCVCICPFFFFFSNFFPFYPFLSCCYRTLTYSTLHIYFRLISWWNDWWWSLFLYSLLIIALVNVSWTKLWWMWKRQRKEKKNKVKSWCNDLKKTFLFCVSVSYFHEVFECTCARPTTCLSKFDQFSNTRSEREWWNWAGQKIVEPMPTAISDVTHIARNSSSPSPLKIACFHLRQCYF